MMRSKTTHLITTTLRLSPDRTAYELSKLTGMWSGSLYPALMRLEAEGVIESRWQDENSPWPRRRVYALRPAQHSDTVPKAKPPPE